MAREKILVVDDNLDLLSKIYLALTQRNFKVLVCINPEEIWKKFQGFKAAVIILNSKEYLAIHKRLKIPAVVMVEKENEGIRLDGGDISIKKPVQVDELVKAVRMLV